MKHQNNFADVREKGLALPITLVILLVAAMVTLYLTNTSRKEQQVSTDLYRTQQSFNAAMGGLDWGIDHYNSIGLVDANDDDISDLGPSVPGISSPKTIWIGSDVSSDTEANASGDLIVKTNVFFCDVDDGKFWTDPENCGTAPNMGDEHVGVVSIGYSDDDAARRVMSVVLAGAPLLPPAGPGQPLTAKDSVAFNGNILVINRYFNVNVWSGQTVSGNGTPETYVGDNTLPLGIERFNGPDGLDPDDWRVDMTLDSKEDNAIPGALVGSTVKRGNNADVLENDPVLTSLSICTQEQADDGDDGCSEEQVDEFFKFFLNADKQEIEDAAKGIGQYLTCDEFDAGPPTSGVVWVEGDCDLKGNTYGSFDVPVAIFVNGDAGMDSNARIFGLVYVMGTLTANGGAIVKGSVIAEKDFVVSGAGTMDIVYDPVAVDPGPGLVGRRSIVAGTWKDWDRE